MNRATLIGWAVVVALAAALAFGFWWSLGRSDRALDARDAAVEGTRIEAGRAELNADAGRIVERTLTRETIIRERAEEAADVVLQSPGADAPVPADVLDGWRAGIGRMRADAQATAAPGDPGGGDAAGSVPKA